MGQLRVRDWCLTGEVHFCASAPWRRNAYVFESLRESVGPRFFSLRQYKPKRQGFPNSRRFLEVSGLHGDPNRRSKRADHAATVQASEDTRLLLPQGGPAAAPLRIGEGGNPHQPPHKGHQIERNRGQFPVFSRRTGNSGGDWFARGCVLCHPAWRSRASQASSHRATQDVLRSVSEKGLPMISRNLSDSHGCLDQAWDRTHKSAHKGAATGSGCWRMQPAGARRAQPRTVACPGRAPRRRHARPAAGGRSAPPCP